MRASIRSFVFIGSFVAISATIIPFASAGVIDKARAADHASPAGTWLAWGGQTRFHFNPDELDRLGVSIVRTDGVASRIQGEAGVRYEVDAFPALDTGGLEINHVGRVISGIGGGALRHAGGLVLNSRDGTIDLRGFALRASPNTRIGLDVVDAYGTVWFTADHAHYGFESDAPNVFSMRQMNLRLSKHFAEFLGHPEWNGDPVGGLDFRASSYEGDKSLLVEGGTCTAPWPDPPTSPADVLLIYDNAADGWTGFDDSVYVKRCQGCTSTSTTGALVVDQDSSLRNAGTTAVAWYTMFQGEFPPYNNDQHPFLVWNTYRIDGNGRIKQIGVSGVKHAFYTVNWNCGCAGGNVIWPTCEDTYSNYNNDSSGDLGPRSEIIPYTAQWGRCGSVYDENCDGVEDGGGGAQTLFEFRTSVVESELQPPLSDGAHYYHEYWYVARDDHAIYNSMGWREVAFNKSGSNWNVSLVGDVPNGADFHLGPTLNLWIDPTSPPANAANEELSTPLGRARVAVKVTSLGGGQWRYEYAVENFDYAHAQIDAAHPNEPDLKLDSDHGFVRFSVPYAAGTTVSSLRFDDTDTNAGNDWSSTTTNNEITWTAPSGSNSLDWGTLYHFEFVADAPPGAAGSIQLVGIATATEPEQPYTLAIIVPQGVGDTIFRNGFD
jgi:hypothetical protein